MLILLLRMKSVLDSRRLTFILHWPDSTRVFSSFSIYRESGQSKMITEIVLVNMWRLQRNGLKFLPTEKLTPFLLTHQGQPFCLCLQESLSYLSSCPINQQMTLAAILCFLRVGSSLKKYHIPCWPSVLHCNL